MAAAESDAAGDRVEVAGLNGLPRAVSRQQGCAGWVLQDPQLTRCDAGRVPLNPQLTKLGAGWVLLNPQLKQQTTI